MPAWELAIYVLVEFVVVGGELLFLSAFWGELWKTVSNSSK